MKEKAGGSARVDFRNFTSTHLGERGNLDPLQAREETDFCGVQSRGAGLRVTWVMGIDPREGKTWCSSSRKRTHVGADGPVWLQAILSWFIWVYLSSLSGSPISIATPFYSYSL